MRLVGPWGVEVAPELHSTEELHIIHDLPIIHTIRGIIPPIPISHMCCCILLSWSGNKRAIHGYAENLVKYTLKSHNSNQIMEYYDIIRHNNTFCTNIPNYLKLSSIYRNPHHKMINCIVQDGFVYNKNMFRLVCERIRYECIQQCSREPPYMPEHLCDMVQSIKNLYPVVRPTQYADSASTSTPNNPPCIGKIVQQLNEGVNVPHRGRFILATYLLARGNDVESCCNAYENAPDYNARVTLYQIGKIKDGGYKVPSCQKIIQDGYCPQQCGRRHPLSKQ